MRFWYFPELVFPFAYDLSILFLWLDVVLFAVVCIVESVDRVPEDVLDVITNIHGIFLKVSMLQFIGGVQELFIEASLLPVTT